MHTTLNPPSASRTPVSISSHVTVQTGQIRRAIEEGNIDAAERQVAQLFATSLGADRARALNVLATLHRAKGDILDCARGKRGASCATTAHFELCVPTMFEPVAKHVVWSGGKNVTHSACV